MNGGESLPETLTLEEAYRAAFFLTDSYIGIESSPDEGLMLFHQYLRSDPARWDDWKRAVRLAVDGEDDSAPLSEDLSRD